MAVPALRFERMVPRFGVGSLVARSYQVWGRNLWRFAIVMALAYLPVIALVVALGVFVPLVSGRSGAGVAHAPPDEVVLPLVLGAFAASIFLVFVAIGAFTYAAILQLSGKRVRLGALLGAGFRRGFPILGVGLLMGLAVFAGFVVLIVPGVVLALGFSVAIPAVVVEREGVFAALGRSWELTRGSRFTIFAGFLAVGAINWIGTVGGMTVIELLSDGPAKVVLAIAWAILAVTLAGLNAVVPAVAYHDLRVAREGAGTEDLVKVFE